MREPKSWYGRAALAIVKKAFDIAVTVGFSMLCFFINKVYFTNVIDQFEHKPPTKPTVVLPQPEPRKVWTPFYAKINEGDRYLYVEKGLNEYVDEFERQYRIRLDSNFRVDNLSVSFVKEFSPKIRKSLGQNVVGLCETGSGHVPTITILRPYFEELTAFEREELVFHELGHCVMWQMDHRDGKFRKTKQPKSLMNSRMIGDEWYNEKTREYYLNELFGYKWYRDLLRKPDRCGRPGGLTPYRQVE